MIEEIFITLFKESADKYFPQYITGELSLQEVVCKVSEDMSQKYNSQECDKLFKKEFEKFVDVTAISDGERAYFVFSEKKEKLIKVCLEQPAWQMVKDNDIKSPHIIYRYYPERGLRAKLSIFEDAKGGEIQIE